MQEIRAIRQDGRLLLSISDFMFVLGVYKNKDSARASIGSFLERGINATLKDACIRLQFPGARQQECYATDLHTLFEILTLLRGKVSNHFRKTTLDMFIRVQAGDQTIHEEVDQNIVSAAPGNVLARDCLESDQRGDARIGGATSSAETEVQVVKKTTKEIIEEENMKVAVKNINTMGEYSLQLMQKKAEAVNDFDIKYEENRYNNMTKVDNTRTRVEETKLRVEETKSKAEELKVKSDLRLHQQKNNVESLELQVRRLKAEKELRELREASSKKKRSAAGEGDESGRGQKKVTKNTATANPTVNNPINVNVYNNLPAAQAQTAGQTEGERMAQTMLAAATELSKPIQFERNSSTVPFAPPQSYAAAVLAEKE
eukprot:767179-Hanusia_phi.AAC.1